MRTFGKLVVAGIVVFAVLQAVRPSIPAKAPTAEVQAPPEVKRILAKNCYSCHSDQRRLSWFDEIVPGYWLVRHDILTAREHLNFSTLGSKPAAVQKATLYEAVNMIQLGAMPLPSFVRFHPEAKVTPEELATLKAYLAPWTPAQNSPGNASGSSGVKTNGAQSAVSDGSAAPVSLATVQPEPNGFPFDPTFESWKPLSTTDRGDNNTFRFVLGNDIAMKAAQSGNISPWPDGARFAKIAWQQELGPDGLMRPGKFIQVELMLKDAHRYKDTEGWGWGRWRGLDLKPYGEDARFVNECTSCHRPMRGNDYVYTLPITTAKVNREEVVNNSAAALPMSLPYQPLSWSAITMYVDPRTHTMATLYGNDTAMQGVQADGAAPGGGPKGPAYPAGAVLALVTWLQRDDPHWFGARIPAVPQSVEFVQVAASGRTSSYRRFAGTELIEDHPAAGAAEQRASFVLSLAPARLH
ncbi:MAG TPA: cytochrome P460 family protein [Candidatus Sulfotelmatobacter sp.]